MDTGFNIYTKISGQAEYNALVDKINQCTASINETAKAAKIATGIYRGWGSENNALKPSLAANIVAYKEMVSKGIEPLTTANGKMMKSYFQTGEALRTQTAFAGFLNKGFQTLGMSTERATNLSNGFGASLSAPFLGFS